MVLRTLNDLDIDGVNLKGMRVLVRVDFNVPIQEGAVRDLTRMIVSLPTIREISEKGGKVILLSHRGRPQGRSSQESLRPLLEPLRSYLAPKVNFAEDVLGSEVEKCVQNLSEGGILLLENLRFYPEEEENDPLFAASLARLGDIYVNDAFSVCHRAHASVEGLTHLLPSYAGRALQAEIEALEHAFLHPERPVAALIGGAKISTKINILKNLLEKVNVLIIGGAMAHTFLQVQGHEIGQSFHEPDLTSVAQNILSEAARRGVRLLLPVDAIVSDGTGETTKIREVAIGALEKQDKIFDIGPRTITLITEALESVKTLIWNGPVGLFEVAKFAHGTCALAQKAANLTREGKLFSLVGGGDTLAALNQQNLLSAFSYVSTAGGAFLEWLGGETLPGLVPLFKN